MEQQTQLPTANYPYPPPRRKRHVLRWVLLGIVGLFLLFIIIGLAAGGGGSHSSGSAPHSPPTEVPFGTPAQWRNEEILLSAPREHEVDNQFLGPSPGNRFIAFDVTVRNISAEDRDVITTEITVQHTGRVAQEAFVAGSQLLPQNRIPPGGQTTWTKIYEIAATPGELRVSVRPTMFSGDTVYFVGQV